jgi:hypothetical protein
MNDHQRASSSSSRHAPAGVQVSGPLHDKRDVLRAAGMARDTIQEHVDKMTRSPIVQASALDPMLINPRANGAKGG